MVNFAPIMNEDMTLGAAISIVIVKKYKLSSIASLPQLLYDPHQQHLCCTYAWNKWKNNF